MGAIFFCNNLFAAGDIVFAIIKHIIFRRANHGGKYCLKCYKVIPAESEYHYCKECERKIMKNFLVAGNQKYLKNYQIGVDTTYRGVLELKHQEVI